MLHISNNGCNNLICITAKQRYQPTFAMGSETLFAKKYFKLLNDYKQGVGNLLPPHQKKLAYIRNKL